MSGTLHKNVADFDMVSLSNRLTEAEWTLEEIYLNAGSIEEAKRLAKEFLDDYKLRRVPKKHSANSGGSG